MHCDHSTFLSCLFSTSLSISTGKTLHMPLFDDRVAHHKKRAVTVNGWGKTTHTHKQTHRLTFSNLFLDI